MRKLNKVVKIGQLVSCPVGYDYSGKYLEYECSQIVRFFKNTKNEDCAEVKVWYHSTGNIVTKKVKLEILMQPCYYHCQHEEIMFKTALELEGKQVINTVLEYHRLNNRCTDLGYINSVTW